eukprot:gene15890-22019_t
MAEQRATTTTVKSIRIKLKNVNIKKKVQHAAVVPALDSEIGLKLIGHLPAEQLKSQALKRKAEFHLDNYPGPSASCKDIVDFLRKDGVRRACLPLLPRWDSSLELPLVADSSLLGAAEFSSKKFHSSNSIADGSREGASKATPTRCETLDSEQAVVEPGPKEFKDLSHQPGPSVTITRSPTELEKSMMQRPGSCTSDQATTSAFKPSFSDLPSGQQSHQQTRPGQGNATCSEPHVKRSLDGSVEGDRAAGGAEPSGVGVPGTATQAGPGCVLPPNFLGVGSPSVLYSTFNSLDPLELQMPLPPGLPTHEITEAKISSIISSAADLKRSGDALRGSAMSPWRVKSLSKYVEASLMYMEACEYMSRLPRTAERQRAASLYGQTADLLVTAAKLTETMRGAELCKEALRILSERLAAACSLRESTLMLAKFTDSATRVTRLLQMQSQNLSAAHGSQKMATPSPMKQRALAHLEQPSPDCSAVSSQDRLDSYTPLASNQPKPVPRKQMSSSTTAELEQAQVQMLSNARKLLRFTNMMRRSTMGFQAMIERSDLRENEFAKQACKHMAAMFMSAGMADGLRLLAHARGDMWLYVKDGSNSYPSVLPGVMFGSMWRMP